MAYDNNSKDPFSNFAFPDDHIKLPKFSGRTPWTVMSTQLRAYLDLISLDTINYKVDYSAVSIPAAMSMHPIPIWQVVAVAIETLFIGYFLLLDLIQTEFFP